MRKLLYFLTGLLLTYTATAQNAVARVMYEEAEAAFAKNDFKESIRMLDDAEKQLGSTNPKILYLRIMAQAKLLDGDETYATALKQNCDFYLKNYSDNNFDKYKEIYHVSEVVVQYLPNADYDKAWNYLRQKDTAQSVVFMTKAAQSNYGKAIADLGWMYENGAGVSKNLEEAANLYKRAAEKGNKIAMNNLGIFYFHGRGVPQDYSAALSWFLKADAPNYDASVGIADSYFALQDYANAYNYYIICVNKNPKNIWAQYRLGWLCYYKEGISGQVLEYNYRFAHNWFLGPAQAGNTAAMNFIGVIHDNALGWPRDVERAVEWYTKAADKGDYYALGNLAKLYEKGDGVKKDKKKAKELLEKQATATKY